jgi:hypothetical protein
LNASAGSNIGGASHREAVCQFNVVIGSAPGGDTLIIDQNTVSDRSGHGGADETSVLKIRRDLSGSAHIGSASRCGMGGS